MSRVDFYILPDTQRTSQQQFACKLAEKAWQQGNRILIQTASADESHIIDELLWTLKQDSFIPHAVLNTSSNDDNPILISHEAANDGQFQLMINLTTTIAEQDRFERIAEILNQDEASKQMGREHYKLYRNQGYDLNHHDMS
ncbi:MAG: DNA polymerase III subunit chi [Gammaproteobacteria bacterium]|nr:DNA polymerase III subunit chi [Gammaproteobacteria bacterium]